MKPPSKTKLRNFRNKIKALSDEESAIRFKMKKLFDQFILDVGDSETALRHVRQAYYQIQKHRVVKQMEERMEFHPFFGVNQEYDGLTDGFGEGLGEEDDDII